MSGKYRIVQRQVPNGGGVSVSTGAGTGTSNYTLYAESVPIGWTRWRLWLRSCPLWSKPPL